MTDIQNAADRPELGRACASGAQMKGERGAARARRRPARPEFVAVVVI